MTDQLQDAPVTQSTKVDEPVNDMKQEEQEAFADFDVSRFMSKDGPTVRAVVLKADGTTEEIAYDTTPRVNKAAEILGSQPTIIGQFPQLNVIVVKGRFEDGEAPVNKHSLRFPLNNDETHLGSILLYRVDDNAEGQDFTIEEYTEFAAKADEDVGKVWVPPEFEDEEPMDEKDFEDEDDMEDFEDQTETMDKLLEGIVARQFKEKFGEDATPEQLEAFKRGVAQAYGLMLDGDDEDVDAEDSDYDPTRDEEAAEDDDDEEEEADMKTEEEMANEQSYAAQLQAAIAVAQAKKAAKEDEDNEEEVAEEIDAKIASLPSDAAPLELSEDEKVLMVRMVNRYVTQDMARSALRYFMASAQREPTVEEFNELLISVLTTRFVEMNMVNGEEVEAEDETGLCSEDDSDYDPNAPEEREQLRRDEEEDALECTEKENVEDMDKLREMSEQLNGPRPVAVAKPVAFYSPISGNKKRSESKLTGDAAIEAALIEKAVAQFKAKNGREPTLAEKHHLKSFFEQNDKFVHTAPIDFSAESDEEAPETAQE